MNQGVTLSGVSNRCTICDRSYKTVGVGHDVLNACPGGLCLECGKPALVDEIRAYLSDGGSITGEPNIIAKSKSDSFMTTMRRARQRSTDAKRAILQAGLKTEGRPFSDPPVDISLQRRVDHAKLELQQLESTHSSINEPKSLLEIQELASELREKIEQSKKRTRQLRSDNARREKDLERVAKNPLDIVRIEESTRKELFSLRARNVQLQKALEVSERAYHDCLRTEEKLRTQLDTCRDSISVASKPDKRSLLLMEIENLSRIRDDLQVSDGSESTTSDASMARRVLTEMQNNTCTLPLDTADAQSSEMIPLKLELGKLHSENLSEQPAIAPEEQQVLQTQWIRKNSRITPPESTEIYLIDNDIVCFEDSPVNELYDVISVRDQEASCMEESETTAPQVPIEPITPSDVDENQLVNEDANIIPPSVVDVVSEVAVGECGQESETMLREYVTDVENSPIERIEDSIACTESTLPLPIPSTHEPTVETENPDQVFLEDQSEVSESHFVLENSDAGCDMSYQSLGPILGECSPGVACISIPKQLVQAEAVTHDDAHDLGERAEVPTPKSLPSLIEIAHVFTVDSESIDSWTRSSNDTQS